MVRRYKMTVAFSETTGAPYVRAIAKDGGWSHAGAVDDYGWVAYSRWYEDVQALRQRVRDLEGALGGIMADEEPPSETMAVAERVLRG